MDSPPAVYSTAQGGADVAQPIATSLAGLGFETSIGRPPEDLTVEFCDYPFTQRTFTFRQHLEVFERELPAVAVAPDIEPARPRRSVRPGGPVG